MHIVQAAYPPHRSLPIQRPGLATRVQTTPSHREVADLFCSTIALWRLCEGDL
jgi:hypothetical protein